MFVDSNNADLLLKKIDDLKKEEIKEIISEVGEEHRDLVEKCEEIKEKIYDTFSDEEVSSETVMMIQGMVESIVENVTNKKVPTHILAKLTKQNASIADHSVNVANLAVFFGMVLGHGHQFVLENIYLGALFHDFAKTKIPEKLLEDQSSRKYVQAIQDHPSKGKELVKQIEGISDQVLTIIEQHHEQYNGRGFPRGLSKEKIYDLAQVVSIANVYDNALSANKNKSKIEMHKVACKILEYDKGKLFDPNILPRAVDAAKLAFANFTRLRE